MKRIIMVILFYLCFYVIEKYPGNIEKLCIDGKVFLNARNGLTQMFIKKNNDISFPYNVFTSIPEECPCKGKNK